MHISDPPLNVCLVGYGYWGQNLGRNLQAHPATTIAAVVDPNPERRTLAGQDFRDARIFKSLDEALSMEPTDAIVISSPVQTHSDFAMAALRAGKHVLVEKPLALDPVTASDIAREAKRVNRVLMVGHTFLYSAPVRYLHSTIAAGHFGDIRYLYAQRLNLGRIRSDCSALWNFGPHDVSIASYILDEDPVEASARRLSLLKQDLGDVYFCNLTYPSGVGFHFQVSWLDPRKVRSMTVVGAARMAVYDDVSADEKIRIYESTSYPDDIEYTSFSEYQWKTRSGDVLIPKLELAEPLHVEIDDFVKACTQGTRPLADGAHGVQVVRALSALDESAEMGGAPVKIA